MSRDAAPRHAPSGYKPPPSHRGYPCAKCGQLAFEFYGTGADAWCADCRFGSDERAS